MKNKWLFITTAIVLVTTLSTLITVFALSNNYNDSNSNTVVDSSIEVNERDVDWNDYSTTSLTTGNDEDVNITSEEYIL